MKRVIVLSFLAALGAAPMLALNPTPASAFGWCSGYGAPRGVIAPRARVYGYTAYRGVPTRLSITRGSLSVHSPWCAAAVATAAKTRWRPQVEPASAVPAGNAA